MTDHELIETAAKAAGYVLTDGSSGYRSFRCYGGKEWNPLADDGDALRLAVRLGLRITPGKYKGDGTSVDPVRDSTAGCTCFRDDVNEQTRRAIVTAAAEIGKARAAASISTKEGDGYAD